MNTRFFIARKNKGLIQDALAASVGINHADINRIEKHDWIPPKKIREGLAKKLGVTEEHLFGVIPDRVDSP